MTQPASTGSVSPAPRYLRPVEPLHFPTSALMPVSRLHADLRALLYQLLRDHVGLERATFGTNQFMYWDAADPQRWVAPDALVKLGPPDAPFDSWKVWERGAPDVAVEIVSESDRGDDDAGGLGGHGRRDAAADELAGHRGKGEAWATKLERYRALGVVELVRFDSVAPPGARLRQWERVEGDLVERDVEGDFSPSVRLDLDWTVGELEGIAVALRITAGRGVPELVPSRAEGRRAGAVARIAAEARVAELEADLARRG